MILRRIAPFDVCRRTRAGGTVANSLARRSQIDRRPGNVLVTSGCNGRCRNGQPLGAGVARHYHGRSVTTSSTKEGVKSALAKPAVTRFASGKRNARGACALLALRQFCGSAGGAYRAPAIRSCAAISV